MLPVNVSKSTTPHTPHSLSLREPSLFFHRGPPHLQCPAAHPRSPLPSPGPPRGVPTPCLLNLSSGSLGTALCPQPTRSSKSPHWSLLQLFCLPCQAPQIDPPCLFPSPPPSSSAVVLPTAALLERIWPKFQAHLKDTTRLSGHRTGLVLSLLPCPSPGPGFCDPHTPSAPLP